jgi:hypothetical protein
MVTAKLHDIYKTHHLYLNDFEYVFLDFPLVYLCIYFSSQNSIISNIDMATTLGKPLA